MSAANVTIVFELFTCVASHAHKLNSEVALQNKIQKACSMLDLSYPPMVHFENEAHQSYLNIIQNFLRDRPTVSEEMKLESQLVALCQKIMLIYLNCTQPQNVPEKPVKKQVTHWILPLGSAKKEEMSARTALLVSALKALSGLDRNVFRRYISNVFPVLVNLIRCEHSSGEVQHVLSNMFESCIGPIIMG